jgi:phospholipase C
MPAPQNLAQIDHFIVLMMENRSFDHILGFQLPSNLGGLSGNEFNLADPVLPDGARVQVGPAISYGMPFDPGHEFADVQRQLYGPVGAAGLPSMCGFLYSALNPPPASPVPNLTDASRVLQCFQPAQLPVLSTLAAQFAVANGWYSSLPGPTWPNRFFIHAATSGGLTESPNDQEVIRGYSFDAGTLYDRLSGAGLDWRIYHDGLPQTAGIQSLRTEYIDPLTERFRDMTAFASDVASGRLPHYVFIEPDYDTGNNYQGGNSMHPLNDVRRGEDLIRSVYETVRNSAYWTNAMLIITFDEHGGFFDHCFPPASVPTGDDYRYATPGRGFGFDRYGVRVPNVIISAYTAPGTILDGLNNPNLVFDHASVLATAELRFGLEPLTDRDKKANTLIAALNLADARDDAPSKLPAAPPDLNVPPAPVPPAAQATSPLSDNQQSFLALATACKLGMADDPSTHSAIWNAHQAVQNQQQAANYIAALESQIIAQRQ